MAAYRRKIILINKRFQLRFCLYVCAWLFALCFIYPLILSNLFDYFIRYVAADPTGPDPSSLFETRREVLTLLILTEIAFGILTFVITLFISHRIAGPLFKLRQTFESVAKGAWKGELKFREKDYFPELADDFNTMIRSLNDRARQENEMLSIATSRIEAAMAKSSPDTRSELEPALVALKKIQDQKAQPSA